MGFSKSMIKRFVAQTFKTVGELNIDVVYKRVVATYNPSTSKVTNVETEYNVKAIMVGFSQYEIDRVTIFATDSKCIVQQKDLPLEPNVTSDLVVYGGKAYNIIRSVQDAANATWTLHVRAN